MKGWESFQKARNILLTQKFKEYKESRKYWALLFLIIWLYTSVVCICSLSSISFLISLSFLIQLIQHTHVSLFTHRSQYIVGKCIFFYYPHLCSLLYSLQLLLVQSTLSTTIFLSVYNHYFYLSTISHLLYSLFWPVYSTCYILILYSVLTIYIIILHTIFIFYAIILYSLFYSLYYLDIQYI